MVDLDLSFFSDEDLQELLVNAKNVHRVTYATIDGYSKVDVPIPRLMHINELQEKILAYQQELDRRGRLERTRSGLPHPGGETTEIFLSHSSQDVEYASTLAQELGDSKVFFSPEAIRSSESFVKRINTALAGCDTGVVLWSEAALASKWVENEVNYLTIRRNQGEVAIQVVRIEPVEVPPLLQDLQIIDDHAKPDPERVAQLINESRRVHK